MKKFGILNVIDICSELNLRISHTDQELVKAQEYNFFIFIPQ